MRYPAHKLYDIFRNRWIFDSQVLPGIGGPSRNLRRQTRFPRDLIHPVGFGWDLYRSAAPLYRVASEEHAPGNEGWHRASRSEDLSRAHAVELTVQPNPQGALSFYPTAADKILLLFPVQCWAFTSDS